MLPCVDTPGASSTQPLPFPSSRDQQSSQTLGYHNTNRASFGCIWSSQHQPPSKWCYFALLPCHRHSPTHTTQTVRCSPEWAASAHCRPSALPISLGTGLDSRPYHPKEKCSPENDSPAWGTEGSTQSHHMPCVPPASLDGDTGTPHLHKLRHHGRRKRLTLPTFS